MKKLFILSLFALASIAANAQLVKSRTFAKEESNTTWYTRLGLSFNNIAGNPETTFGTHSNFDFSFGPTIGYDLSFGFQKPILHSDVYWGMDLGLGSRGYSNSYTKGDGDKVDEKLNTHNVKFSPLTFGYKHAITDIISLDFHIGGYVSYDYAGKFNKTIKAEEEEETIKTNDIGDFYPLDSGIIAGGGIWYDRFNIELTYQRGFISLYDYNDDMFSSNFMIRLGVAF